MFLGRGGFLWPGLNAPVLKDGAVQSFSRRNDAEQQEVQAELSKNKHIEKFDFLPHLTALRMS